MTKIQNSKFKIQNLIDWHCHLLPGLDDGAADMDEAVAIARILSDAGFSEAFCTPHQIKGCYDSDDKAIGEKTGELQKHLDASGIDLLLHPGSEYYLDEYLLKGLKDCVTFRDTQYLLVEISNHMTVEFVQEACHRIRCRGYIPVIAHPERCRVLELPRPARNGLTERCEVRGAWIEVRGARCEERGILKASPDTLLEYLVEIGCCFQGNIGSFAGIYGDRVRGRAITYLRGGLYSCLGSDAHSSRYVGEWLDKGLHEIEWDIGTDGLRELLEWVPFSGWMDRPPADEGLGLGIVG